MSEPGFQSWKSDIHAEVIHTRWRGENDHPDLGTCVGVHVHPSEAGRHFRATPAEHIAPAHKHNFQIPGAIMHRIPDDHHVILHPEHCTRIYAAILGENQLKNRSAATLEENLPSWTQIQATAGGGELLWKDKDDNTYVGNEGHFVNTSTREYAPNIKEADLLPVLRTRDEFKPTAQFDVETGRIVLHGPYSPEMLADLHAKVRAVHGDLVSVV